MKVTRLASPGDFLKRQQSLLMQNEAENNLFIGISISLVQSPEQLKFGSYLSVIEDDGVVVGCALFVPPQKLLLSRLNSFGIESLIENLIRNQISPPGILGPVPTVDEFARIWSERFSLTAELGLKQRVYRLKKLLPLPVVSGQMRRAWLEDFSKLEKWALAFVKETGVEDEPAQISKLIRQSIESRRLFVWDDGGLVAMAGFSSHTPSGVRINLVYSPPEKRGRGYAQSCVAKLNDLLLQTGKTTSFLFADIDNPISNHIYQKIGYEAVCDFNDYKFLKPIC